MKKQEYIKPAVEQIVFTGKQTLMQASTTSLTIDLTAEPLSQDEEVGSNEAGNFDLWAE